MSYVSFLFLSIMLQANKPKAVNPLIWADVPDPSIIRVGKTYYMSSTTMHMSPGLPIFKSKDLTHWKLVSYAYDRLADVDELSLRNEKNAYGRGSWASSLRYHNGTYYATTFSSTTGKTYIFSTKDPEKSNWTRIEFAPSLHDHSLVFQPNGRVFMAYGSGDIMLVELKPDLSGPISSQKPKVIVPRASIVAGEPVGLPAEGTQVFLINGMYYILNIAWPKGGMRTAIIHRSSKLEGPYESRVLLQDRGIAQGGLIDTPDGKWFAYLFQDHGAVGRIPYLAQVTWIDGWPVVVNDGKVPMELDLPEAKNSVQGIVASDEFNRNVLSLVWQWNHNPADELWSLSERKGHLRLKSGRLDREVTASRNILTQRTFGPASEATISLNVSGLKNGDTAGLIALQGQYAYIGVKREDGTNSISLVSKQGKAFKERLKIPIDATHIFLKAKCDFNERADKIVFEYSLNEKTWKQLGEPYQLRYDLEHFMGCRFGLFYFSTQEIGGHADFDYFRILKSKPW